MPALFSTAFSQDKAPRTKAFPRLSQMWKVCRFIVFTDCMYAESFDLEWLFYFQTRDKYFMF